MVTPSDRNLLPYFPRAYPLIPGNGRVGSRHGNQRQQFFIDDRFCGRAYSSGNSFGVGSGPTTYNPDKRIEFPGVRLRGLYIDIFA
jgi:hypothetical protein